jgi:uncharacterized membrane protein
MSLSRNVLAAVVAAASLLAAGSASANVYIRIAPPAPRHEVIIERDRPGPDHVWVPGYWNWNGTEYVWAGGRWDLPPRPHAHWVPGHYRHHRRHGYYWIPGHWR